MQYKGVWHVASRHSCPADARFCNEDNGWCGNSNAHRDAQASTTYDYCSSESGTYDDLTDGEIAGIVIGVLAFVAMGRICCWGCWVYRKYLPYCPEEAENHRLEALARPDNPLYPLGGNVSGPTRRASPPWLANTVYRHGGSFQAVSSHSNGGHHPFNPSR